jgi:hypothetical protein
MVNVLFVANAWSGQAHAATTENLLSNDFTDGTWSGTNLSSLHGNSTIAGIDNSYVESQITLSDHLLTPEINSGFTATLDGEVWIWNDYSQSVTSTLKIVSDDDEVTEQNITLSGTCSTWNGCSYGSMGSNTIVIGNNDALDYTITSTFSFSAPGTTDHYAADLKNPSLNITYEEYIVDFDTSTFSDIDISLGFETFVMDEQFDFTLSEPMDVQTTTVDYEINEIFFYEEQSPLDTDVSYEEIPMESYEDEIPNEQFDETGEFLEEPIQEESFDEEQQFIEEEIFFSEEQDIEFIDEQPQDIVVAEQEQQSIDIEANFEDIVVAQIKAINVMVNTQPIIIDRQDFYISEPIYTNQVDITDNRQLYENVVFNVFDPMIEYTNKVNENKSKQEQLMRELRETRWNN